MTEKLQIDVSSPERAISQIIDFAIASDASDIHINPRKDSVEIFLRSRGALYRIGEISHRDYSMLSFEMKRRAGVNAVVKKPHDGRYVHTKPDGEPVPMRFASVYCKMFDADKVTFRIPGKDVNLLDIDKIQFRQSDIMKLKLALRKSFGLLLVTGPTGSGKTTTLYAALNYIKNLGTLNILTAEDPVESPVKNTVQIETTDQTNFEDILVSFLRHDPDVIMIGETRNKETADISVRAALTGHLVLTTLHANTALLSVTRMLDLGIDPFNLIFTLVGILNQRLLRTLCPHCRVETAPNFETTYLFNQAKLPVPQSVFEPNDDGCQHCISGISGRTIVYEMLTLDNSDQTMMFETLKNGKSLEETFVPYYKAKQPYQTLLEMSLSLVVDGVISAEEVLKFA